MSGFWRSKWFKSPSLIQSQRDLQLSVALSVFGKKISPCVTAGEQNGKRSIPRWSISDIEKFYFQAYHSPFSPPHVALHCFIVYVWLPSSNQFQQGAETLGTLPLYPRKGQCHFRQRKGVNATLKWLQLGLFWNLLVIGFIQDNLIYYYSCLFLVSVKLVHTHTFW